MKAEDYATYEADGFFVCKAFKGRWFWRVWCYDNDYGTDWRGDIATEQEAKQAVREDMLYDLDTDSMILTEEELEDE